MTQKFERSEFIEFIKNVREGKFERINTNIDEIIEHLLSKVSVNDFTDFFARLGCFTEGTKKVMLLYLASNPQDASDMLTALLIQTILFMKENEKIITDFLGCAIPTGKGV